MRPCYKMSNRWPSFLCFTLFVVSILVFTIVAAKYQSGDPLIQPSTRFTKFLLASKSNATFKSDAGVVYTGEDLVASNETLFAAFINSTDVDSSGSEPVVIPIAAEEANVASGNGDCKIDEPINCHDFDVFHVLMRSAMEAFTDIEFYRFGTPVRGDNDTTCHMAWQFRRKEGEVAALDKDYRSFAIVRTENCTISVGAIGEYQSGGNAWKMKKKANSVERFDNQSSNMEVDKSIVEVTDDGLLDVDTEGSFSEGKYLVYSGGSDGCQSMNQYLWSFMCSLGEAVYLNRTLIVDLSICTSTSTGEDKQGKDFRFYFDFEHLMDSAQVMEQSQFWSEWGKRQQKDGLGLHYVNDFKVTPMQLANVEDTLIMRKFGSVEPNNYWYQVCEGEAGPVIDRPWRKLWKSRQLLDISVAIAARMNWDYNSVHVERGEKVRNKEMWPNLDTDTSPAALLSTLKDKIEDGSNLYISTNEPNTSFFDALKDKYSIHFLDEHKDLWDTNSDWYEEMRKLNNGKPVEFDKDMRASLDSELFLKGKKQIETFNDLTRDCKEGVNTCTAHS